MSNPKKEMVKCNTKYRNNRKQKKMVYRGCLKGAKVAAMLKKILTKIKKKKKLIIIIIIKKNWPA